MKIKIKDEPGGRSGSIKLKVRIDKSGLHLAETPFGVIVEIDDFTGTGIPGGPSLPSRVIRVALPALTRVTGVSSRQSNPITLTRNPVFVAPVQHPRAAGETDAAKEMTIKPSTFRPPGKHTTRFPGRRQFEAPRPKLYRQEARNFRKVVRLTGTWEIGPVQVAALEVKPVRLNRNCRLKLYNEIDITVHYRKDEGLIAKSRIFSNSQARRLVELARAQVENPDQVWDFAALFSRRDTDTDYLVITDNQTWNEAAIEPTGGIGDIVSVFRRLADWKEQRGLTTRVVTVSDIVDGLYGDFKSDARDLQEVIRKFLQWAYTNWGIAWVLLGGDVEVIPVRTVAGALIAEIEEQGENPPPVNASYWDSSECCLKMCLNHPSGGFSNKDSQDYLLVQPESGSYIPYIDQSETGMGDVPVVSTCKWYFTLDDYTTQTGPPVNNNNDYYVRVQVLQGALGGEDKVRGKLQWLYHRNLIPTDLYYSSLAGFDDFRLHDWDGNRNGIYGQHYAWVDDQDCPQWLNHDGVSFQADVSVGRAPVSTPDQANNFVDKVIGYEKFSRPDGTKLDHQWPRRLLLHSSNWDHRLEIEATGGYGCPPGENQYCCPDQIYSLIKINEEKISQTGTWDSSWHLIAQVTDTDLRILPYFFSNFGIPLLLRGWYFAISETDLSPSEIVIAGIEPLMDIHIPVASEWIVVHGPPEELQPQKFLFDRAEPDQSMLNQEVLREQLALELPEIDLVSRLYEDEIDLSPAAVSAAPLDHLTGDRLEDALNSGPHFVSFSGHGSDLGSMLPASVVSSLNSDHHTFIGYADSCWSGEFDADAFAGSDSLGENLLNNPGSGAVAHIGSSRYSWVKVGDDFQRNFFHVLSSTGHLGLLHDARLTCPSIDPSNADMNDWGNLNAKVWTIFALNLLGDPEMPVWVGTPLWMKPTIIEVLDLDNLKDNIFEVKVEARFKRRYEPLAYATVNVRSGKFNHTTTTDRRGTARIPLPATLDRTLLTTVSCPGYVPVTVQTLVKNYAR
jgi:hypothetical protein